MQTNRTNILQLFGYTVRETADRRFEISGYVFLLLRPRAAVMNYLKHPGPEKSQARVVSIRGLQNNRLCTGAKIWKKPPSSLGETEK